MKRPAKRPVEQLSSLSENYDMALIRELAMETVRSERWSGWGGYFCCLMLEPTILGLLLKCSYCLTIVLGWLGWTE